MPFLSTVMPRRSLGAFLDFDAEVVRRNRMQGYYDAMKQFGRFDGLFYTFTRLNDLRSATLGRRLSARPPPLTPSRAPRHGAR